MTLYQQLHADGQRWFLRGRPELAALYFQGAAQAAERDGKADIARSLRDGAEELKRDALRLLPVRTGVQ